MAVLGIQFVITMMMATVLSRVGPHLSLARWLLCSKFAGLVRYLHPSDDELRVFAPVPKLDKKDKKKQRNQEKNGSNGANPSSATFNVPRNIEVQLETAAVDLGDLVQLRYYTEYQWLVDFSCYSMITYMLSEVYIYMLPDKATSEVNLSLVWVVLVIGFTYKLLLSLNGLYFEGEEAGGERSLVLVMGGAYLLFAMLVLLVDESTLETGLDEAYKSFNNSAAAFLENNAGLDSSGPASKLVLMFFIALWCGLIGALFTFPGLRVARMHWDVLRYSGDNARSTVLYHIGFIAPLILTTLWVKPLTRDPLTVRLYKGMSEPLMTGAQFETVRLYLLALTVFFKLIIMPRYLQAYLNLAYDKIQELRQEAGKISNVDYQRRVIRVFYYLCVVTLQYTAPMILILYLSFLYKTLGGGSWAAVGGEAVLVAEEGTCGLEECGEVDEFKEIDVPVQGGDIGIGDIINQEETVEAITEQFSLAWATLKNVFTVEVFRGLLGFSTWWCCFVWFSSAAIGIGYQSYFSNV
eukprot:GFUD01022263.1.p1 GENE.GFUD01022263.1~~GFUD01022263.1.p1  ORF type:complete len:522 (+),score=162.60 GFUD01022263.1:223-1788(+)